MAFETSICTRALNQRLALERDPIVRRNLETLRQHMEAELNGDLEAILATLIPEPVFHLYNLRGADGNIQNLTLDGYAAVRENYRSAIASGSMQQQEWDISLYVVDAYGAAQQGRMRLAFPGATLMALDYDVDPAGSYLYEGNLSVFWPLGEGGRFVGEDIYFDPAAFVNIVDKRLS